MTDTPAPTNAVPAVIKGDGFNPQGGGFATLIVDGVRYPADAVRAALAAAPVGGGEALDPLKGWTPHDGAYGEPPAVDPATEVWVLRRSGKVTGPYPAGRIEWHHQNAPSDPLFYRLAALTAPSSERSEAVVLDRHARALQSLVDKLAATRTDTELEGDMSGDMAVVTLSGFIETARGLSDRRPSGGGA